MPSKTKFTGQTVHTTPTAIETVVDEGKITIGGVQITGWNVRSIVFASSPVTAAIGDRLNVDISGGSIVINLPAVPSVASVRNSDVNVKHVGGSLAANSITVNAAAGDTIDGAASVVYNNASASAGFSVDYRHDGNGTNWRVS